MISRRHAQTLKRHLMRNPPAQKTALALRGKNLSSLCDRVLG